MNISNNIFTDTSADPYWICPHVRDQFIPLNGGRLNLDHYLRVLRAKALSDPTLVLVATTHPITSNPTWLTT